MSRTPPGGEKRVPGVLHQPIHQAYKGFLKLGLTRPITASTVACAACNKSYQQVVGSRPATALSFSHVHDAFQIINHMSRRRDKQQLVRLASLEFKFRDRRFTQRQT